MKKNIKSNSISLLISLFFLFPSLTCFAINDAILQSIEVCGGNHMPLDLTGCVNLKTIKASSFGCITFPNPQQSQIQHADMSNIDSILDLACFPRLLSLKGGNCKIKNIEQCKTLQSLFLASASFEVQEPDHLILKGYPELKSLKICWSNPLNAWALDITISDCPKIEELNFQGITNLRQLNLSCPQLKSLSFDYLSSGQINLTNCPNLKKFDCSHLNITVSGSQKELTSYLNKNKEAEQNTIKIE